MTGSDWFWVVLFVVAGLPTLVLWESFVQSQRRRRRRVIITKECHPATWDPDPPAAA